jgi:ERCC4-related helicase
MDLGISQTKKFISEVKDLPKIVSYLQKVKTSKVEVYCPEKLEDVLEWLPAFLEVGVRIFKAQGLLLTRNSIEVHLDNEAQLRKFSELLRKCKNLGRFTGLKIFMGLHIIA